MQIHMGMDMRLETQRGTWGVLGGQQLKGMGKLSDWHHISGGGGGGGKCSRHKMH